MAPVCSLCYAATDTRDHLFVTCNFAADIWPRFIAFFNWNLQLNGSFLHLSEWFLTFQGL